MFSIPSREFHQTKAGAGNRELVGKPTKLSLLPPAGLQHLRWPFFTSTLLGIFLCYQVGQLTTFSPAQPSFPPPFHARAMFLSTSDYSDLSEPNTVVLLKKYPHSYLRQLLRELPVVHQSQSEFTSKHRFQPTKKHHHGMHDERAFSIHKGYCQKKSLIHNKLVQKCKLK